MSKVINKSRQIISKYLKDAHNYKSKNRTGTRWRISPTKHRLLLREARTGRYSAQELVMALNFPSKKKKIQEILRKVGTLQFWRQIKGHYLSSRQTRILLEWASNHVRTTMSFWNTFVWSDEKKFNLEGSDGSESYWYEHRIEQRIYYKRQSGGGSVIIWACF